jgi:hypothetical protein
MESGENGFMMFVAEHSDIETEDIERLFYNGFDNPESLSMLNLEQLQELQISDPAIVLAKIEATLEVYTEIMENGGKINPVEAIQEHPEEDSRLISKAEIRPILEEPLVPVPKDGKELSREIMLGNLPTSNKKLGMSKKEILDSMTHLHMANKKIYSLNVKAGKFAYQKTDEDKPLLAAVAPELQVLFLQENYLTTMGDCF